MILSKDFTTGELKMKLSKDEIVKKLAQTVLDYRLVCGDESGECFICEELAGTHKEDCPVLLAEEVLKDLEVPKCESCGGSGVVDIQYRDNWERTVRCYACNGIGVKK